MQWIKASERMPGWNVMVNWRMSPNDIIQKTTAKDMMGWASMFLKTLQWADESESTTSVSPVEEKRKEAIDFKDYCDTHSAGKSIIDGGKWRMMYYKNEDLYNDFKKENP